MGTGASSRCKPEDATIHVKPACTNEPFLNHTDSIVTAPTIAKRRRRFVGANWKCSIETPNDVDVLVEGINKCWRSYSDEIRSTVEVCVFPPYIFVERVRQKLDDDLQVGSQNAGEALKTGKNTGSVTAVMLRNVGCKYVMLGHSDRRNTLGETDRLIALKVKICLACGLCVNLTIGETRESREAGVAIPTLFCQLAAAATEVPKDGWGRMVIAYEPVWAIGEGATPCTPEEAQLVLSALRGWLHEHVSEVAANECRLVYTGSVTRENAAKYAVLPDVDGLVVGRAGLSGDGLLAVCHTLACCKFFAQ